MAASRTDRPAGRTDWSALRALSDDEIERAAADDEDNPPTDANHWAMVAGDGVDKVSIHASFDRDVIEFFKRGSADYQSLMNDVLRRYMEEQRGA